MIDDVVLALNLQDAAATSCIQGKSVGRSKLSATAWAVFLGNGLPALVLLILRPKDPLVVSHCSARFPRSE